MNRADHPKRRLFVSKWECPICGEQRINPAKTETKSARNAQNALKAHMRSSGDGHGCMGKMPEEYVRSGEEYTRLGAEVETTEVEV